MYQFIADFKINFNENKVMQYLTLREELPIDTTIDPPSFSSDSPFISWLFSKNSGKICKKM